MIHIVVQDLEGPGNASWAVDVHCRAGPGKIDTCIGVHLRKHYRPTAIETIGWTKVCRPCMVIGLQQHFLQDIQGFI